MSGSASESAPFISVIVPTLNEAENIPDLVENVRHCGECELIVVDGGSTDATWDRAAGADLRLRSEPGRAVQQNAGAAASRGDVLLFLHADCRLEPKAFEAIRQALSDPKCVGGCFRQRIDADGWAYRLLECGNALRVRWFGLAYGDQGIFVRREVFERIGGFPKLRLMEDVYLMKRLRRERPFRLIDARLHVSPRRWQQHGIIRQTQRNWTLLLLAHCGVSPNRLARFYPPAR